MPNPFDRILKENSEEIFKVFAQHLLKVKIVSWENLPTKIHTTEERELDFVSIATTDQAHRFILHIEFQTANDSKMLLRFAEYHGLLLKKYNLPIEHIMVYLGERKIRVDTELAEELQFKSFTLIKVNELDPEQLLKSQVPEQIILALLANYRKENVERVLANILHELNAVCKSDKELSKYIKQLNILSRLRNLHQETVKIINQMPITLPYPVEEDTFYKRGLHQGLEKEKIQTVLRMFKKGYDIKEIASISDLSPKEVNEILKKYKT